jgi:hypothetical protein
VNSISRRALQYSLVPGQFAVCRLPAQGPIPEWVFRGAFQSVTRTLSELSVVCARENIPAGVEKDAPWICFKLAGPFPFLETGILASFIGPLADHGIPVFATATFETDYILIKEEFAGAALEALREAGHKRISE